MDFGLTQGADKAAAEAFAAALQQALGEPVRLQIAADYERLWEALRSGAVRLAWLPPLLSARAAAAGLALAALPERGGGLYYRAAILVRRDSGELMQARAAWVDPSSASGYTFPRAELAAAGVTFSDESFFGSLNDAARAVIDGRADVCACYVSARAGEDPARMLAGVRNVLGPLADDLRVVRVTEPIPPDSLVLSPGPGDDRIVETLLGLHRTVSGLQAIQGLLHAERLLKPLK
ncbi:MAG: phosphate/phosphite/phosphonate ABC transporter substrate-binding protein [Myxococcales bacterium]